MEEQYIQLGTKVKDRVTGFIGIAIARVTYLNGCVQYLIKPIKLDKDNKPLESVGIDFQQLKIVDKGLNKNKKESKKKKSTGGIMTDIPKDNISLF